ncbi:MAG TPA: LysR substrate-binding domain-containing protein, partial [Amycolatopsis sp.]|nr:LysR substrate-binding domain-containing protein [Amycolatopsis sp.]
DLVVGLLPEALPETLDRIQLRSSRLTAVVPVEDPFAQAGAVSLAQLAMRPLITWPRAYQPGVYDAIEAALDDAVKSWSLVATASHFEGIVSRVMSGQGCALVPSTSVEEPEVLGIACLPVSDDVHFIEYAAWNRQPAHDVLTEFVATLAQECSGQL